MPRYFPSVRAALGAWLLLCGAAALAQPRLLSAQPAGQAAVASLQQMELHFSEKLVLARSDVRLTMTAMPGVSRHPDMGMAIEVKAGGDGRTLLVEAAQPLPRGSYRLDWRAVSARTHRLATGVLRYTVP